MGRRSLFFQLHKVKIVPSSFLLLWAKLHERELFWETFKHCVATPDKSSSPIFRALSYQAFLQGHQ